MSDYERFYAEVKSGDWACPNGCIAGEEGPAGYFGPWGPGCGTCGWGRDADASRLPHGSFGDPCRFDGLPRLAEPHCGWREATAADTAILDDGIRSLHFHD